MRQATSFLTLLGSLVMASGAAAQDATQPRQRTAEQEVWELIIRERGRGAALRDSTWGDRCGASGPGCDGPAPEGVPAEAWQQYLELNRAPSGLRGLLPADMPVTFVSELPEQSALPCRARRSTMGLSRAGFSADGTVAVVWTSSWYPMNHLGCGAVRGALFLLRRDPAGAWKIDRPLMIVTS